MSNALAGKKILVTGGTGFIGGRLVEKLVLECNADVRVMVRNFARAFNIARFDVEMIYGDINVPADSIRAVAGCDIVIHCAYGNSGDEQSRRSANVQGTRNVLDAALRAGAKRFVHLSTMQVYGPLPDGDVDETSPRRHFGHGYSDSKLDAEEIVLEYFRKHELPVVILQPTIVYGPNSLIWTTSLLCGMMRERYILINDGEGYCNAVYVDDVADAAVLASVHREPVGESFLISAEEPVTWREFYASYERMLGTSATICMPENEARTYEITRESRGPSIFRETLSLLREDPVVRDRLFSTREAAILRRMAETVLPAELMASLKRRIKGENGSGPFHNGGRDDRPIHRLSFPLDVQYYKARARVRIDKAKRLLGYEPAFDLSAGMARTEQWARWANVVEDRNIRS